MGRKFVTSFLVVLVLAFMCGCTYEKDNSNKGYATVYIDGIGYDLTEDIDTLAGKWSEQGYFAGISLEYEEDGKSEFKLYAFMPDGTLTDGLAYKESLLEVQEFLYRPAIICIGGLDRPEDKLEYIMASAKQYRFISDEDHPTSINNRYRLGDDMMELYSFKYKMEGIDSTNECIKQLNKNGVENLLGLSERCVFKGYYTVASNTHNSSLLIAVFYDGEPVDLAAYMPNDLEVAYNECRNMKYGLRNYHKLCTEYPYIMDGVPNRQYDYSDTYFESISLEYAFDYAYQKGAEKILKGEISEVVAVSFGCYECRVTVMKADDILISFDKESDKAYFQ